MLLVSSSGGDGVEFMMEWQVEYKLVFMAIGIVKGRKNRRSGTRVLW